MAHSGVKRVEVELLATQIDDQGKKRSVREISGITGVAFSTVQSWIKEQEDRGPLSPEAPVPPQKALEDDVAKLALIKSIDLLNRLSKAEDKETQNVAVAFSKLVEKYLQLTGQGPTETLIVEKEDSATREMIEQFFAIPKSEVEDNEDKT